MRPSFLDTVLGACVASVGASMPLVATRSMSAKVAITRLIATRMHLRKLLFPTWTRMGWTSLLGLSTSLSVFRGRCWMHKA
ncbi:hypothetical protein BCR44DRAFT_1449272 [Catenaria anguillulae PL171]|uniref:Uncharacterized protein n=1 Tax=Catenaria anguillulae PL171 TaxID=765915 RepID=A0A1Y2H4X0_9FUNG|nr:hypothetical protein BCR44DRAFT_1449272 [Catenaria anguillulae PL171]